MAAPSHHLRSGLLYYTVDWEGCPPKESPKKQRHKSKVSRDAIYRDPGRGTDGWLEIYTRRVCFRLCDPETWNLHLSSTVMAWRCGTSRAIGEIEEGKRYELL